MSLHTCREKPTSSRKIDTVSTTSLALHDLVVAVICVEPPPKSCRAVVLHRQTSLAAVGELPSELRRSDGLGGAPTRHP